MTSSQLHPTPSSLPSDHVKIISLFCTWIDSRRDALGLILQNHFIPESSSFIMGFCISPWDQNPETYFSFLGLNPRTPFFNRWDQIPE